MTSKEMEQRSGVARANIRYYEAEGLLAPRREKNGYRDYSEQDLAVLEKIKLLRRLGVSIEELKALFSGQAELAAVLERRLEELRYERQTLRRVEEVCGALQSAGETFATLEPEKYLQALDAPELAEKYLRLFCKKADMAIQYVQTWMPVVAAAQMTKHIESERALLEKWISVAEYQ